MDWMILLGESVRNTLRIQSQMMVQKHDGAMTQLSS